MARTARNNNISLEEKLNQVLVPDVEQPYIIPKNWKWVYIGEITNILNGFAFKSAMYTNSGIRIIRITNVQDGFIEDNSPAYYPVETLGEIEKYLLKKNDLLISLTGNVGRVAILSSAFLPAALNQRVGCLRIKCGITNTKYLYYFLLREDFQKDCIKNAKGSAQLNMSTEWLKEQAVPLPPLAEQQRIVERIESMFAKLDEAKVKVQAVIDGYKDRKATILHKAFSGEMTTDWREKIILKSKKSVQVKIKDICNTRAGFAFDSKKFTSCGYQIVRIGNLYGGVLNLERSPVFINKDNIGDNVLKKSLIADGDILLTLTGTKYKRDYGYAVKINGKNNLLVNQRILCLTPKENVVSNYVLYFLQSEIFRDVFFSNETGGVNQGNVSSCFVENIELSLPQLEEQKEIVRILDKFFDKEQKAKEIAERVIEQIDSMKKSILARAFRGKLGTNDPTDEPAIEQLKKIL